MSAQSARVDSLRILSQQLGTAVIQQRQVLANLEQQHSLVLSQLNFELGGMPSNELPIEIVTDIFMRALPDLHVPDPDQVPMSLLGVCRRWKEIALANATSSLWSTIQVVYPRPRGFEHLLDAWLARANDQPLSISMRGKVPPPSVAVVKQYAHQLRNLELYIPTGIVLQQLTTSFPALETLVIAQSDLDPESEGDFARSASGCVELLRAAPNLLKCTFTEVYFRETHTSALIHSSLQDLRLGMDGPSSSCILEHLQLPALKNLYISDLDIGVNGLRDFLHRSSPPLCRLFMPASNEEWSANALEGFFRLIPSLTDLELVATLEHGLKLIDVLATAHDFLPKLRNVTIKWFIPNTEVYPKLVVALTARRTQMQSFRLLWGWNDVQVEGPDADVFAALRELVAVGMHIHIGTEESSFV
ncbi:hypothetical protein C8R43DRAFT_1136858 [Mycena crocata]|nr:hypothetical protein C8R43DRAFT_1136858 [Mycena crocata]